MATSTVRISEKTHEDLREIAAETGQPMADILAKAIEDYRRKIFMEQFNAAYTAMRSNPKVWREELAERASWDSTLADGLEDY